MIIYNIEKAFIQFKSKRVLVIGDAMIDTYVFGRIDRMSPEAPIPVIVQQNIERRLGGAANVALNLKSMGCDPVLATVIGDDENGRYVRELMDQNDLVADCLIEDEKRVTTEKRRIIDGTRQVVRVDIEETTPISVDMTSRLIDSITNLLPEVHVLIFQDYDKGVLNADLIQEVIVRCNQLLIPVVVDPKERNYFEYKGCALFKPNLREFGIAHESSMAANKINELKQLSLEVLKMMDCGILLLTLSENGLIISNDENTEWVSAAQIKLKDVSGAGDTVVAVAALGLAIGLPLKMIGQLANQAGAIVCEQDGVVAVNRIELTKRAAFIFSKS